MDKKFKILIVDDQPNNLKLFQQILGETYELKFARDGTNALIATDKHKPDLILLDIMMPEMDGYEVCRRLKENKQNTHIPVIFVTALDTVEDESKGFQLGCADYITKPISSPIVLARVQTHLELHKARKKLETVNQNLIITVDEKTAEIREQNKKLLTLNKQLTREKEKALASARLKTEFLEQISHEIRTPLNHIVGMSQLLGMDCESMDESEKDEMIKVIMEGGGTADQDHRITHGSCTD